MNPCNICYSNAWFVKQELEALAKKRWREKHPFKIKDYLSEEEYAKYKWVLNVGGQR